MAPVINWSQEQRAIFSWFEADQDASLIVRARAGTGKTTTIIEGVNRAPEPSILVCAFNKLIATELTTWITNPAVEALTLHALGLRTLRRFWRGVPVAEGTARADYLTNLACDPEVPAQIRRLISSLHTKCRDIIPLTPTADLIRHQAEFFDLVPDDGWAYTVRRRKNVVEKVVCDLDFLVRQVQLILEYAAIEPPTYDVGIDYADMIFLPLTQHLLSQDYQLVVVDEAQDLTVAQLLMAQQVCCGRIAIVGDDRQAIYGFRGADSASLDRLKQELQARELPLKTTYRCGQQIVRQAQRLVPDIEAAVMNPEGEVLTLPYDQFLQRVQPGDFVLSRLNAPLVGITLRLLRQKTRARMNGRDLGRSVQSILKHLKVQKYDPIDTLLIRLDLWEHKVTTRLAAAGMLALVDRARDQAGMLRALAEDTDTVKELLDHLDFLFTDETDVLEVLCSSVHKIKGMEAPRVFLLMDTLYRRGDTPEERNIEYVAITRAQQTLVRVTELPGFYDR